MALTLVCVNGFEFNGSNITEMSTLAGLSISGGWSNQTGRITGKSIAGGTRTITGSPATFSIPHIKQAGQTFFLACSARPNVSLGEGIAYRFEDTGGVVHIDILIGASGEFIVKRGDGTTLATSAAVMTDDVWGSLQVKIHVSDTVGIVQVYWEGNLVVDESNIDTRNGGAEEIGVVKFAQLWLDDVVMWTGASGDAHPGPSKVRYIKPASDSSVQWTPSSGANNWDRLLDRTTTAYVEGDTVTEKDLYGFDSIAEGSDVWGISIFAYAVKTDVGARGFKLTNELSATETQSAEHLLTTTHTYYEYLTETKPGGGVWTETDINNATFGQELTT